MVDPIDAFKHWEPYQDVLRRVHELGGTKADAKLVNTLVAEAMAAGVDMKAVASEARGELSERWGTWTVRWTGTEAEGTRFLAVRACSPKTAAVSFAEGIGRDWLGLVPKQVEVMSPEGVTTLMIVGLVTRMDAEEVKQK